MEHATRIPPAAITGVKGALVKRMMEKKLGKVPTAVGVYWHNPRVLFASFGLGGKLQQWNACDEGLKSFAHMAVASLVGCTWCLDCHEECMISDPSTVHRLLFIEVPTTELPGKRIHFDVRPRERRRDEEVARLVQQGLPSWQITAASTDQARGG